MIKMIRDIRRFLDRSLKDDEGHFIKVREGIEDVKTAIAVTRQDSKYVISQAEAIAQRVLKRIDDFEASLKGFKITKLEENHDGHDG